MKKTTTRRMQAHGALVDVSGSATREFRNQRASYGYPGKAANEATK